MKDSRRPLCMTQMPQKRRSGKDRGQKVRCWHFALVVLSKVLPKLYSRAVFLKLYCIQDHLGIILKSTFGIGSSGVRTLKLPGDADAEWQGFL